MTKKLVFLLLVLVMLFSFALAEGVSVTDMYGRQVVLDAPATRIVALSPADCEILCALGCGEALVGRGAYCDYPASILAVPAVESGAETNIEQIIALEPQVVLLADMAHSAELVQSLENAGIRVVVSNADSIDGVYTAIGIIGQLMGKTAEADALIADMQHSFDEIRFLADSTGLSIYFEISPLEWGLWTGGQGTFMHEISQICGVENLFYDVTGWAEVSEEQVLARNPDIIVTTMMYFGEGPTPVEEILSRESWQDVTAVKNGAVFNASSDELTRPGPRLKDAAWALYHFIIGTDAK